MTAYVITRDQLLWTKPLVEFLAKSDGIDEVVLVDNDSTYPPMVDWLAHCPYTVSRGANQGHLSPYYRGFIGRGESQYFLVTDPDLAIDMLPGDWVKQFTFFLDKYDGFVKIGSCLKIDDLPLETAAWVVPWEKKHWQMEIAPGLFRADIDTTLFVGRRSHPKACYGPALRVKDLTVRHMPWYVTPCNCPEDFRYYLQKATKSASGRDRYMRIIYG